MQNTSVLTGCLGSILVICCGSTVRQPAFFSRYILHCCPAYSGFQSSSPGHGLQRSLLVSCSGCLYRSTGLQSFSFPVCSLHWCWGYFFKAKQESHLCSVKNLQWSLMPTSPHSCRPLQTIRFPSAAPKLYLFLLLCVCAFAHTFWNDLSLLPTNLLPVLQASTHNCDPF